MRQSYGGKLPVRPRSARTQIGLCGSENVWAITFETSNHDASQGHSKYLLDKLKVKLKIKGKGVWNEIDSEFPRILEEHDRKDSCYRGQLLSVLMMRHRSLIREGSVRSQYPRHHSHRSLRSK
ncbi:hypothetical protein BC936DRAFT_145984 [Jimgerdemannia flammicorona]|uniref:Uncharacterized protein n=1 Tax=Jimgerdemannia flammicorona TaxID=994334 RepID=A0A433DLP5_9FUNG|nr:hypothetical protein BC936DRAFT_145984 [Jimgerdemannia flammicorona]